MTDLMLEKTYLDVDPTVDDAITYLEGQLNNAQEQLTTAELKVARLRPIVAAMRVANEHFSTDGNNDE